ncbi:hypothetical protein QUF74_04645 [Candidatus Halobeggiatoa sp. HSG11]|nr:hypothetical protein [Candidatus Halobeggiatoa sp. HSG11]
MSLLTTKRSLLAVDLSLPTTNVIIVDAILVVDGYLDKLCPNS